MQPEVIQGFRLSPQQKRLWLLQGQGNAYRAQAAIEIEGALATEALKRALSEVTMRNEILRTRFASLAGMKLPVQVIANSAKHDYRRIDAQSLPELLEEDRRAQLDLNGGPVLRCTLVCLSTNRHLLILTLPSLCADSRSLVNLTREIARCYEGELTDENVQYVQFAEWQNELLEADEAQAGLEFWRKRSLKDSAAVSLPLEHTVTETREFQPAFLTETIPSDPIVDAASRHGVSVERFLLACWQTFISRVTNEPNISMSLRCDGRVYEEMHDAIGLYEKWVPVHGFLGKDFQFGEIVRQVNSAVEEAYEWQEYFTPGLDETATIGFSFEESPEVERVNGLSFRLVEKHSCTERFKLKLSCVQATRRGGATEGQPYNSLKLEFGYDPQIFSEQSVGVIARQFRTLVEHVLQHADLPIGKLKILGEVEREQVLVAWNNTARDFLVNQSIPELFAAQVERTPDAPAVSFEGDALNYRELDRRSNQLAHYLLARGVAAETRVAVCLERSIDMLVAVFGIWKSGATYVPLDPMQPKKRLDLMIQDAHARLVLGHSRLEALLPDQTSEVIYLDSERERIEQENDTKPELSIDPRNLAYVIYTSGSTGQPKGAMIEHRSVVNLALALQQEIYGPTGTSLRISLNAPLAFDSSVKQIVQLLSGHALHILPEEVRRDGQELHTYLQRNQIDVFDCTPSQLSLLIQSGWAEDESSYPKTLLVGGEAVSPELWRTLAQRQNTAAYNVYGPTECTVDATTCRIANEEAPPSIGKPLPNVQTYVLDEQMQPVSIGATGELYIGGAGLARGYLDRPEFTADKFRPNPFSNQPGARVYKTGDRARHSACGDLEFLGRVDHQVKIRGSRIELGEIEAALAAHPDVREAVVIVRESGPDDKRLVAYVASRETAPSHHELHTFLHDRLPEYMMPAAFVMLDALPLMPNGKVDRHALPAPDQRSNAEEEYVAPRNATESLMAEIWASVLGVDRVGISNNFFELGGHSLLATQVVSQVRHAFQVEIPLRNIFETPTVAGLSESVEKAKATSIIVNLPELRLIPRDEDLPLSFAQQRLWFLEQLDPANIAYNIPYAVRLTGALDHNALERCLTEIVRRHEVLRTTFTTRRGKTVQVIASPQPWVLELHDLQALTDQESEARRMAGEEARRPFDLEHGPLLRTTLLRLAREQHVLLFTMHHIVFDAWSIGILLQEMGALYQAFAADQPSPLPELTVQYADFAHWQTNLLQGETLANHVNYWKTQLAGAATLELPTDRPRPAVQTFKGAHQTFTLSEPLARSVYELSRREGVTLFMTLLAAFKVLLHRYTAQADISVGTPIANRNYREIEGLIGFFINTLVLRTDLSGDPSFSELLQRVRDTALEAYAHQDLPFEKLVEELQPDRNLGRTPFFQVLFTVRNITSSRLTLPDLSLESLDIETGTSKFDLVMSVDETEQGINFGLEYNTDIFADERAAAMAQQWERILAAAVAHPERRISELPLVSEEEQQRFIAEWNEAVEYPSQGTLYEAFEEQAARTPDAVAVVCDGVKLTYAELNGKANQLAHHLARLGVGPEQLVGVCMDRSLEMVVALLGVLKAGGAYLPLDPAYPKDRLAFMTEDARVRVIVAQEKVRESLREHHAEVVYLDTDWERISLQSSDTPKHETTAANTAYVIYTSGSTGKPKGVCITHRNVVRLFQSTEDYFHFDEYDVWTLFHSYAFDFSVWELWGALLYGGKLVVVPYWVSRSPEAFYQLLKDEGVTVLNQTPSAFRQLIEVDAREAAELSLRLVIFGGEALELNSLRPWFERHGDAYPQLVNMYGITETTVHVTYRPLRLADVGGHSVIGHALPDLRVCVLDEHLHLVAAGVTGEMYVGGAGLGRGYLNRPELTAERFIPDPFSNQEGARIYKTGDLARFNASGELEYFGRGDAQVKIRGFRVELGEIETIVNTHDEVRESAVLLKEVAPGDERLVVYVVPRTDAEVVSGLRNYLKQRLPEFMVPSAFVFVKQFPLTQNGKVDRRALPLPGTERPDTEVVFVAPRTLVEETIVAIWSEVLGREQVGINDNFFDLGGHSLLATQVLGRVREVFPVELPLRTIFESPTVAGLIERMVQEVGPIELAEAVRTGMKRTFAEEIPRRRDSGPWPLSFAQERIWFFEQLESGTASYNVPTAMRVTGPFDIRAVQQSLTEIVRRHEVLRTVFEVVDGKPVQRVAPASTLAWSLFDLRQASRDEREARAAQVLETEARRPFNLAVGPLLRCAVVRLDDDEHVAQLTVHHIAFDGWSRNILVKEFTKLYEAFTEDRPSPLAELPLQYADFAVWQREWLQGETFQRLLSYWQKQLAAKPGKIVLPTDRPAPPGRSFEGALESVVLSKELTLALRRLSRREDVTLFMLSLAAFKTLLYRYTWQDDTFVGTPIANRTRAQTEELIGFFVNTLVLRTDVSGNPTFRELLVRVRATTLDAYAHQDMPFDKLVNTVQSERDLTHDPLFQVFFSLNNNPAQEIRLPRVTLKPFPADSGVAKFDLEISLVEWDEQLIVKAIYKTALFDSATIKRWLDHYRTLLQSIVATPEEHLLNLPIESTDTTTTQTSGQIFRNTDEFTFDDLAV